MQGEGWQTTVVTGIVAGFFALVGFFLNQAANRRERKSKVYAEALTALKEYAELPFRIRRRASSNGETRAALGGKISDVLSEVGFYTSWLQIDSYVVGRAYRDLIDQSKRFGTRYRAMAWEEPIIKRDQDAVLTNHYETDNKPELENCVLVMRRELSLWAFLSRHKSKKLLDLQRQKRADAEPVDGPHKAGSSDTDQNRGELVGPP